MGNWIELVTKGLFFILTVIISHSISFVSSRFIGKIELLEKSKTEIDSIFNFEERSMMW